MKFWLSSLLGLLFVFPIMVNAKEQSFDYEKFTNEYFAAWTNVQKPQATKQDLEHYLTFLTDDIGYQHLPYSNDDSRAPDGKVMLRKGMNYYLGIHTQYQAKLTNKSFGHNVIMIEFRTKAKGIHPDNGQEILIDNSVLEVFEIEQGKISVIRHYSN
ncbi:hypothetical protein CXF85_21420 [Colwellia sp. 75C3]|uniref:hypothetical protein n=1 Tax=Colwellia sp. 75C3 TaxID=888425 RepID=UPI000C3233A4|nr:hypothetical protein [Colwellia sp. 75C3]PKG80681.1 hypothetical protein CXF85_21420 [Colwellia sp. 75C3]